MYSNRKGQRTVAAAAASAAAAAIEGGAAARALLEEVEGCASPRRRKKVTRRDGAQDAQPWRESSSTQQRPSNGSSWMWSACAVRKVSKTARAEFFVLFEDLPVPCDAIGFDAMAHPRDRAERAGRAH